MKFLKENEGEILAFIFTVCMITILVCVIVSFNLYSSIVNP